MNVSFHSTVIKKANPSCTFILTDIENATGSIKYQILHKNSAISSSYPILYAGCTNYLKLNEKYSTKIEYGEEKFSISLQTPRSLPTLLSAKMKRVKFESNLGRFILPVTERTPAIEIKMNLKHNLLRYRDRTRIVYSIKLKRSQPVQSDCLQGTVIIKEAMTSCMQDRQDNLQYRTTFYSLEHFYREGFTVGYFTCLHTLTLVRAPENTCGLVLWQNYTNASYEKKVFSYLYYYNSEEPIFYHWHLEDFAWKEAQGFCQTRYHNGNLISINSYDLLQFLTMRCVINPSSSKLEKERKERCLTPIIFIGLQMEVKRCPSCLLF